MTGTATPEYTVGQPRTGTMAGFRHFYVRGRASMKNIPQVAGTLIDEAIAAYQGAHSSPVDQPTVILSYHMPDETGEFDMFAGFSIVIEIAAAGSAVIEEVPSTRCASILLTGSLAHLPAAYQELERYIQAQGLRYGSNFREWYLYWEGDGSPNNVILIAFDVL